MYEELLKHMIHLTVMYNELDVFKYIFKKLKNFLKKFRKAISLYIQFLFFYFLTHDTFKKIFFSVKYFCYIKNGKDTKVSKKGEKYIWPLA